MVSSELQEVILDNSKSKSGKHAIRSFLFQVENNLIVDLSTSSGKDLPSTYKVGESKLVEVPKGTVVYLTLKKNIKGQVRGRIVELKDNKVVLVMNYRKLKLKRVEGDSKSVDPIKKVLDYLKVPVKKVNLR